jgi:hypothetical protein
MNIYFFLYKLTLILRLFRVKYFLKNICCIFFVFGMTKNNSQTINIFGFIKKAFIVLKNDLYFKFWKSFFEFEYFFIKPSYGHYASTGPPPDHYWATQYHHQVTSGPLPDTLNCRHTTTKPPLNHHCTTPKPSSNNF